jgi:NhaP-type Na+/H+ or K+/H+ antiporter
VRARLAAGSALTWRERLFVMWISPRGIVAASVASLFAVVLDEAGFAEGTRILAITFMAIAITVTLQGLTASRWRACSGCAASRTRR